MNSVDENVEVNVEKMLNGEGLDVVDIDMADRAQAVTLKETVCYIVSAVIFNTDGEVLMVQEAKIRCHGLWYLPAGHMETGESIHEALCREVREEAGLECQPITMLLVQEKGQEGIHFAFLAEVTGGAMKTPSEADSESLQAQWWDRKSPLPLRSRDILPVIEVGLSYRQTPLFPVCNPVNLPCPVVCQRLLFIFTCRERMWLLLTKHTSNPGSHTRLPVIVSEKGNSIKWAGRRLVQECMREAKDVLNFNVRGVLGVQHDGRVMGPTDGICFNTLVTLECPEEGAGFSEPPVLDSDRYTWRELTNQNLKDKILRRITEASLLPMDSL